MWTQVDPVMGSVSSRMRWCRASIVPVVSMAFVAVVVIADAFVSTAWTMACSPKI